MRFKSNEFRIRFRQDWRMRCEQEFAAVLQCAAEEFPHEAEGPYFESIVRTLWTRFLEEHYEHMDRWFKSFPKTFLAFKVRSGWTANAKVEGNAPDAGIVALAKVLVAIRNRERGCA